MMMLDTKAGFMACHNYFREDDGADVQIIPTPYPGLSYSITNRLDGTLHCTIISSVLEPGEATFRAYAFDDGGTHTVISPCIDDPALLTVTKQPLSAAPASFIAHQDTIERTYGREVAANVTSVGRL